MRLPPHTCTPSSKLIEMGDLKWVFACLLEVRPNKSKETRHGHGTHTCPEFFRPDSSLCAATPISVIFPPRFLPLRCDTYLGTVTVLISTESPLRLQHVTIASQRNPPSSKSARELLPPSMSLVRKSTSHSFCVNNSLPSIPTYAS